MRIPRATIAKLRIVFDSLEQQMAELKALRKKVAEAERLAAAHARPPVTACLAKANSIRRAGAIELGSRL
jgi:hypothetical protein